MFIKAFPHLNKNMTNHINTSLLSVKPFQETLHGGYCGPASLKMVLVYYGLKKTEKEIAEKCGRDPDIGTDASSIKKAAEGYGSCFS